MKYKALRFDTMHNLAEYLNANKILQQDIISICERVASNGYGCIELLYIDRSEKE